MRRVVVECCGCLSLTMSVPILDILQSIPILVFLPIALTFFITLLPNNLLGLELAAIFVIFTSQAWNLTFSFYHSLLSQPTELDEAARCTGSPNGSGSGTRCSELHDRAGLEHDDVDGGRVVLPHRFRGSDRLREGPGLSESLPGMGSYMAVAVAHGSYTEVTIAIVVMVLLVVGTNFFVFRPLVAWSDKFRMESSESAEKPKSIVLNLLRRSSIPRLAGHVSRPVDGRSTG